MGKIVGLSVEDLVFSLFSLNIELDHEVEKENFVRCAEIKKEIEIIEKELKIWKMKLK